MESLRNLRIKKGYTQLQMADLLEIQRPTYSRYESGERQPDHATLIKLADILNVTIDQLLGKTDFSVKENYIICDNLSKLIESKKNPPNPDNIQGIHLTFVAIKKFEYQFTHESLAQFATYFGVETEQLLSDEVVNVQTVNNNHGIIGHAHAPVTIINGSERKLSEQEIALIDLFGKLDVIKQAQLLSFAAELSKE